ncbi:MAG: dynamin family protein [Deltaproteobacteria bacterium]|nr:dynamin family protein [Deltaproteobacteria bacterium]
MAAIATEAGFSDIARHAAEALERLQFTSVHLVVLGEFNRGKTTLVNCLIGSPLLPMDIVPTTAAIWTIQKGEPHGAAVVKTDGATSSIELSPASLARLSADGELSSPDIRYVRITSPQLALADDVIVVDTPGVNDINEQRAEITYNFLVGADAALFLMDASSPLTKSEAQFLQGQVLSSSLEKIIFVVNKTDRLDADEVAESLAAASSRLEELLGQPVIVVGCDAARCLAALEAGRSGVAAQWGFQELRDAIDRLLAETREGAARRATAERRVAGLTAALRTRLEARRSVALMRVEERSRKQAEFEAQMEEARGRFDRFVDHCLTHGRDRLKLLLSQSQRVRNEEFVKHQMVRVSTMKGDFGAFCQKVLPYEMQCHVKRWFEEMRPVLQKFLEDFAAHSTAEYAKAFGGLLGLQVTLALDDSFSGSAPVIEAQDYGEYVGLALPAAGFLAASFLALGPFAIVGLVAGTAINKVLQSRHAEANRAQITAEIPGAVHEVSTRALNALLEKVDDWFNAFTGVLREQFELEVARRQADFAVEGDATASATSTAPLESSINALRQLVA